MPNMKAHATIAGKVSDLELAEIRSLVEHRSAILFDSSRERFFSTRVREYVAEKKLAGGGELLRNIRSANAPYEAFLEMLLTQETSFFRYPAVFEALNKQILPEVQERKLWEAPRTLRIWSAGCSTGEEPYSMAITVSETLKFAEAWEIEILATDISQRTLRHAERGVYAIRSLENVPASHVENYFVPTKHGFQVKPRLRRMVSFARMNLADPAYVGKFDCIFCMNVLMYFSAEHRIAILRRFHEALEPGGYFVLGHSETLSRVPLRFEAVDLGDCRLYRKPAAVGRATAMAESAR